jgi:large repetitive protein
MRRIAHLALLALLAVGLLSQPAFAFLHGDNAPPEAVADEINTAEGTPGDTNVLANDTDPDGDLLTILSWTQATHGAVVCVATDCVYTRTDLGFSGTDSFTYTITDGNGGTDVGDVLVTVTPTNEQPVADDDSLTTQVDTQGSVNVLLGDTDADGDTLTIDAASDPAHGSLACSPTGVCTYTRDPAYLGSDSFTYTVSDGQVTDEGLVSVTVEEAKTAPGCASVKPSKTKLWPPQHQLVLVALSGAADADGDPLAYAITAVTQDEKTTKTGPGRQAARRPARLGEAQPDQAPRRAGSEGERPCLPRRLPDL